jgi:hypothetical protein
MREREIEELIDVIDERNLKILRALLYPDPCVTANNFLDGDESYHLPRCPVQALATYFVAFPLTESLQQHLIQCFGSRGKGICLQRQSCSHKRGVEERASC